MIMQPGRSPIVPLTLALLLALTSSLFSAPKTRSRADIPAKYKWNLADIYPDWQAWEKDMTVLEKKMDEFAALKGTLTKSSADLLKAFKLNDELNIIGYKAYRYPSLTRDTDLRDNDVSARFQKIRILYSKFGTATSWFDPELLTIGADRVQQWLKEDAQLAPYRFYLDDLYRKQKHVLDENGERLLSYFSNFDQAPSTAYEELTTSDIKYRTITLSDGKEVTLSPEQYGLIILTNRNQADRRLAWQNSYGVYNDNVNTHAALYNGVCQRDWALAQSRNHATTLDAALDENNIPNAVYDNLVACVKKGVGPLQRYYQLRKKALKLESYHLYDGGIPIIQFDRTYDYDSVLPWFAESVAPLGKDYQARIKKATAGGWIDVYENEGKATGAYSARVYGVHPYLLMNYNGTLEAVFTIAHELGHSMHTVLSYENQPFATADYTIFVAEVASTLNEALFLDYMLEHSKDPKERIRLLEQAINNLDGTFYTQVMFADFERQAHALAEQGQPITADVLKDLYKRLWQEYFGATVEYEDLYGILWSRISHFFDTPYYVYKYATCFAASAKIHDELVGKDAKVRKATLDRYMTLLKSGGNDYPMEQLKKAGVDLTQPQTYQAVVDEMDRLVTRLEKEVQNLK